MTEQEARLEMSATAAILQKLGMAANDDAGPSHHSTCVVCASAQRLLSGNSADTRQTKETRK